MDQVVRSTSTARRPHYSESRIHYSLSTRLESIKKTDEAIVCEGYMDVLSFYAAGLTMLLRRLVLLLQVYQRWPCAGKLRSSFVL